VVSSSFPRNLCKQENWGKSILSNQDNEGRRSNSLRPFCVFTYRSGSVDPLLIFGEWVNAD
jgi:hypothetical protein